MCIKIPIRTFYYTPYEHTLTRANRTTIFFGVNTTNANLCQRLIYRRTEISVNATIYAHMLTRVDYRQ